MPPPQPLPQPTASPPPPTRSSQSIHPSSSSTHTLSSQPPVSNPTPTPTPIPIPDSPPSSLPLPLSASLLLTSLPRDASSALAQAVQDIDAVPLKGTWGSLLGSDLLCFDLRFRLFSPHFFFLRKRDIAVICLFSTFLLFLFPVKTNYIFAYVFLHMSP